MKSRSRFTSVLRSLAVSVSLVGLPAFGQAANVKTLPIIGTWKINISKTSMNRGGPNHSGLVRSNTFTWILTSEGDGIRMNVYNTYPSAAEPTRTYFAKLDGKEYPCKTERSCFNSNSSSGKGETVSLRLINQNLITRVVKKNGQIQELVTYAVSSDGKVFSCTSWSPETPQYHNIQVFDRQ